MMLHCQISKRRLYLLNISIRSNAKYLVVTSIHRLSYVSFRLLLSAFMEKTIEVANSFSVVITIDYMRPRILLPAED